MAWKLNLLDADEFERRRIAQTLQSGDCYYAPWLKKPQHTSERYWREWADRRDPLVIKLPGGGYWNIDQKGTHGDGWAITGSFPNLTATPSVMDDKYHGWLLNGELTDDGEGRTFPVSQKESP